MNELTVTAKAISDCGDIALQATAFTIFGILIILIITIIIATLIDTLSKGNWSDVKDGALVTCAIIGIAILFIGVCIAIFLLWKVILFPTFGWPFGEDYGYVWIAMVVTVFSLCWLYGLGYFLVKARYNKEYSEEVMVKKKGKKKKVKEFVWKTKKAWDFDSTVQFLGMTIAVIAGIGLLCLIIFGISNFWTWIFCTPR